MKNKLILGDCMKVLPDMESESVFAIITDPPYGISYQSGHFMKGKRLPPGVPQKTNRFRPIIGDERPFIWWLGEGARLIKDGGCLICFCRWDVMEVFRQAITWSGLEVKSLLIWDRQGTGMGDLTGVPAPRNDLMWFAAKGDFKFYGKRPADVYSCGKVSPDKMEHPTQKPVSLIRRLVLDYVPPGETVLDPFVGSGTTALACIQSGRNYIAIEKDEKYHKVAERRIGNFVRKKTISGG